MEVLPMMITIIVDKKLNKHFKGGKVMNKIHCFRQKCRIITVFFVSTIFLLLLSCKRKEAIEYAKAKELRSAITTNDISKVKLILNDYPGLLKSCRFNLYQHAIHQRRLNVVTLLISKKVDINADSNKHRRAPLHFASQYRGNRSLAITKLLIKSGANVNQKDRKGNLPVHYAAEGRALEQLKLLEKHDASILSVNDNGDTLLHKVANAIPKNSDADVIKYLIVKGLLINKKNKDGETPLHIAARKAGDPIIVKALLENSADPLIKNNNNQTPLDIAKAAYNKENKAFRKKDIMNLLQKGNDSSADIGRQDREEK